MGAGAGVVTPPYVLQPYEISLPPTRPHPIAYRNRLGWDTRYTCRWKDVRDRAFTDISENPT